MAKKTKKNLILAIESSCDDSSVAIIDKDSFECVLHRKISQEACHSSFGGVVPELAARLHTTALPQLLDGCKGYFSRLCAVAVTSEPGLSVSLLGGVTMAKVLCATLCVPLIAVNHLVGHIYSLFISAKARQNFVCLIVSGGHTMLVGVENNALKILANTGDDSFGESFDKVAKMLDLGYPGGVAVQNLALKAEKFELENASFADFNGCEKYEFPVPLLNSNRLEFSFSGLKNAVREKILELRQKNSQNSVNFSENLDKKGVNFSNKNSDLNKNSNGDLSQMQRAQIALAFEKAAIAHIIHKSKKVLTNGGTLGVVGGASANLRLRTALATLCKEKNCELLLAPLELCADNALMIARAAISKYEKSDFTDISAPIISPKNTHFDRL